jgi:hypothetical protein
MCIIYRYPLGATRLKRKLLHLATRNTSTRNSSLVTRVVSIPYWEWTPSLVTRLPLHASSSRSSASASSSAPSTEAQRERETGGDFIENQEVSGEERERESERERMREREDRRTEQEKYLCRLLRRRC